MPLISQHWLVAVLGVVVIIIFAIVTLEEEKSSIEKFGEAAHKEYMQRVPRVSFLLGIFRLIKQKLFLSS